ncbi:CynX/NimT family MFS transporter [Serratia plymuthica]|uniref:MFS transporter n=1 Tax=Serratia plymuthica TaxID=82996 RepID=UPI00056A3717|nr:MFS transporter [Serratia plymuthica]
MTSTKSDAIEYAAPNATQWPAILSIVFAGIAAALQVGKATIALPELQREFGRSLESLSWVISAFPFVGVFSGILVGILVRRWGDRRLLCLGLMIISAASFVGASLHNFNGLIATRFIEGLGFVIVVVAAPAILNRVVQPQKRNLVFGIWSTFMPAGIALSMFFGPLLGGWQQSWLASAALTLLAALLLPLTTRREATGSAATLHIGLRQALSRLLRARQPGLLALIFTSYNLLFFAVMAFLPLFLMQHLGLSLAGTGSISAAIIAVNMIGNLSAGLLLSRGISTKALLTGTFIAMGLTGSGIFFSVTPMNMLIPLCFLFSAISGMLPSTLLAATPMSSPDPTLIPLCLGLVMQGNYLGQVIAPIAISSIVANAGWSAPAAMVLAAAALGIALTLLLSTRY